MRFSYDRYIVQHFERPFVYGWL